MGFIETDYAGNPTLSKLDIDSDLNLKDEYNIIGVKRFVCQDYLGAVIGTAANTEQKKIHIDITGDQYSEMIRIPSNFVQGSSFRIIVTAQSNSYSKYATYILNGKTYDCYWVANNQKAQVSSIASVYVYKYDPVNEDYTLLKDIITEGTIITGNKRYVDISTLNAGDYVSIKTETKPAETQTINKNLLYCKDPLDPSANPFTPLTNVSVNLDEVTSSVDSDFSVNCDMQMYLNIEAIWDSE